MEHKTKSPGPDEFPADLLLPGEVASSHLPIHSPSPGERSTGAQAAEQLRLAFELEPDHVRRSATVRAVKIWRSLPPTSRVAGSDYFLDYGTITFLSAEQTRHVVLQNFWYAADTDSTSGKWKPKDVSAWVCQTWQMARSRTRCNNSNWRGRCSWPPARTRWMQREQACR